MRVRYATSNQGCRLPSAVVLTDTDTNLTSETEWGFGGK